MKSKLFVLAGFVLWVATSVSLIFVPADWKDVTWMAASVLGIIVGINALVIVFKMISSKKTSQ